MNRQNKIIFPITEGYQPISNAIEREEMRRHPPKGGSGVPKLQSSNYAEPQNAANDIKYNR